ncbi:MAG: hypothetical protein B6245_03390 [Desulfobacteraceae bacterium 4572_88]|nr:MAG: hypothetical protein B6245_03390 [Desulfobacteraceae bacterium 4572_88]
MQHDLQTCHKICRPYGVLHTVLGSHLGRLKTPFSAIIFCPVSGPCETDCNARLRDPEKTVYSSQTEKEIYAISDAPDSGKYEPPVWLADAPAAAGHSDKREDKKVCGDISA